MNLEFAKARLKALENSNLELDYIDTALVYDKLDAKQYSNLVVFIGEAPGANEAKLGRPFCGIAGANLSKLLSIANLNRDSYYITNAFAFRPLSKTKTANRPPSKQELEFGALWLCSELDIIKPKMIVALGDKAHSALCALPNKTLSDGFVKLERHGINSVDSVAIARTFHPSPLVYNMPIKRKALEQFFQSLGGFLATN
jgi:DNA polymerase